MSSTISLKVKYADLIRKVLLPPSPPPIWPRLASALRDRFHVPPNQMIGLRYLDPESDVITISSQDELDELWDEIRAGAKLKEKDGVSRKVVRLDLVIISSFSETASENASPSTPLPSAFDAILKDQESISKKSDTTFGAEFLIPFEIAFAPSQTVFPFDVPYSILSSLELQSLLAMGRNVFDLPNSVHLSLHHEGEGKLHEIVSQVDLQTVLSAIDRSIPVQRSGEGARQAIRLLLVESFPTPTYPQRDVEDADGFVNVSSPSTITFDVDSNVPRTAVKMPHAADLEVPTEACGSPDVCPSIQASSSASRLSGHPNGDAPLDRGLQECHSPGARQMKPPLQPELAADPPEQVAEDSSDPDIEPLPTANTTIHDVSAPLSQLAKMAFNQTIGVELARTIGTYANLIADATGQFSHIFRTLAEHVNSSQTSEVPFRSSTPASQNSSAPVASHQLPDEIFPPKRNSQARYDRRASFETVATQVSPVPNETKPDLEAFPPPSKTLRPEVEKPQPLEVPVPSCFNILQGGEAHISGSYMNPSSPATLHQARIQPHAVTQSPSASMSRPIASLRNLAATPHQMDLTTPVNTSLPPGATPQQTAPQPSFTREGGHPSSHDPAFADPSNIPSLPWYPYLGFEGRAPTPFHVGHLPHHNHFIPRPPMIPSLYNWASTSDCANPSFPGTPFWHPHQALQAGCDPRGDFAKPSKPFHEFPEMDFPENRQSSTGICNFSNYPAARQHSSLENMVRDIHFETPTGIYKTSSNTLPENSCLNTKSNPGCRDSSGRAISSHNVNPKVMSDAPDLSSKASQHHFVNSFLASPHPAAKNESVYNTNFADILQMSKESCRERESSRLSKFNARPDSLDAQDSYIAAPETPLASFTDNPLINKSENGEISIRPKKMPNGWYCDETSSEKAKPGRGRAPYHEPSFQGVQDRRDVEFARVSETSISSGVGLGDLLQLSAAEGASVRPWGYPDHDDRRSDGWPVNGDPGPDLLGPADVKKSKKRNKKRNDRGSLLD